MNTRETYLDGIRGLLLVVMTFDHFPNFLSKYTNESVGYVSAAEGFIFLSGFVSGLVYTRTFIEFGRSRLISRAFKKAGEIYFYHIVLFLLLFAFVAIYGQDAPFFFSWRELFSWNFPLSVFAGAILLYQPVLLTILPMYFLFVLATPFAILLLEKRLFYIVLAVSGALWWLAQSEARDIWTLWLSNFFPVRLFEFDVMAWQALFVIGLMLGYAKARTAVPGSGPWVYAIAFSVVVLMFLLKHDFLAGWIGLRPNWIEKFTLGWVRIINFLALALLIGRPSIWPAERWHVKWLAYLGRNSLQVFSFQVLLVYFIPVFLPVSLGAFEKLGVALFAVVSLHYPAWLGEKLRNFRSKRNAMLIEPSAV